MTTTPEPPPTPSRAAAVKAKLLDPLGDFLRDETAGGVVLLIGAVIALLWANSPWGDAYADLWDAHLALGVGGATLDLTLRRWVNDGAMALFFFVVGMEIKRELVTGELRDPRAAALPAIAAAGGVVAPAAIYLLVVGGGAGADGWAIPTATDIAFAVGALALLGDRVSAGVRLFLLTIAIVDDVIAIVIIAVVYSAAPALGWLALGLAALGGVVALQRLGVASPLAYAPLALVAWLAVHESGVHATIAGVALGLLVPARPFRGRDVLAPLEHRLHPISAFVVVPLFALANAGVDLGGGVLGDALGSSLTWGVAGGLVLGKLVGITGATLLALRLRVGTLPAGMRPVQVVGVGALGGIGFTVSLFVTELAFGGGPHADAAKVGIFAGSLAAGVLGAALLLALSRRPGPA